MLLKIPIFWRFQIAGWLAFAVFSFPLKWVALEDIQSSALVALYRDGLGFVVTIGMREIYRSIPLEKTGMGWLALLILFTSLAGGLVLTALYLAFHGFLDFKEDKIFSIPVIFAIFYFRMGLCAGWSLLYFGIKSMREGIARELRIALIESQRQGAELQMLRVQMSPHFLFNALNTIRAGVEIANGELGKMVQSLSDYLRYSLDHGADDFVPLAAEFEAMQDYLEVEKGRFRDDLVTECRTDDALRSVRVPGIILQPLVENAVKFGRETSEFPLRVEVDVSRLNADAMRISVRNSGQWVEEGSIPGNKSSHLGLANLRRRLALLYPGTHRLEFEHGEGCVTALIEIPILY